MKRIATIERKTKETSITLTLALDSKGTAIINSGIGFLDHMLEALAKHSFIDLDIIVNGDLQVDGHHSVEALGIVLGQALSQALGDKAGIKRFGHFILPMDDALALCAIDLGGRPYLEFDATFSGNSVGSLDTELVREFFYALVSNAGMNLHIKLLSGNNDHHKIEAIFKAFAKALGEAVTIDPRIEGVMSTKGLI